MNSLIRGVGGGIGRVIGRFIGTLLIGFVIYLILTTLNIDISAIISKLRGYIL